MDVEASSVASVSGAPELPPINTSTGAFPGPSPEGPLDGPPGIFPHGMPPNAPPAPPQFESPAPPLAAPTSVPPTHPLETMQVGNSKHSILLSDEDSDLGVDSLLHTEVHPRVENTPQSTLTEDDGTIPQVNLPQETTLPNGTEVPSTVDLFLTPTYST